jgi:thioredoxin-like negative regulator of GroEL
MKFIVEDEDIPEGLGILYFYSPWMVFHKRMINILSNIEEKNKNYFFVGINTDVFKDIVKKYKVTSVPTIILVNKKEKDRIEGLCMASAIKSMIIKYNKEENERK